MRLEFNVLWVEDLPAEVNAQRERIEYLMRKEGFKLKTQFASSVEEAGTFLANDVFGDHIDLILMDFDLGDGPNGGEGLSIVREQFPFKDIVFYSAGGVQRLRKPVSEGEIQGVFCSDRKELPDTVMGVFRALVKKVLDIDHSRGIVMGATSEIDHFVNESLIHVFGRGGEDLKKVALEIVAEQIVEIRSHFEEGCSRAEAATEIADLMSLHHIYSSVKRLRLLRKLLKRLGTHVEENKAMSSYEPEIILKRNDLAHVTVKREGFSRKIFDRKGNEITAEDMQQLRVSLLDHHELFERVFGGFQIEGGSK